MATGMGQKSRRRRRRRRRSAVTHYVIVDSVLHAVKIVASFYKVQCEHIKLICGVLM